MKRRAFIKTAAGLFVPTLALGQGLLIRRTGTVAVPVAAEAGCAGTLKDSQEATESTAMSVGKNATFTYYAFPFTVASAYTACKATLYGRNYNSCTFSLEVSIRSDSGGSPGTVLGTSTAYDVTGWASSDEEHVFENISAAVTNSGSPTYWMVVKAIGSGNTDDKWIRLRLCAASGNTTKISTAGSTWDDQNYNTQGWFKLYA
jgi:hypothetical protein